MSVTRRWWMFVGLLAGLAAGVLTASAARADDDPWNVGSDWLFVRAGYARNAADGAANGGAGYGFGFRHMLRPSRVNKWKVLGVRPLSILKWTLFKHCSIGAFAEYDVLGRYGTASDIGIPAGVELTRYIMWKTAARPYFTLGAGPYYHKSYRTGNDYARVAIASFLSTGMDTPVAPNQMLGFDIRLARVRSEISPANPVFGGGQPRATHWSAKLSYAVHY